MQTKKFKQKPDHDANILDIEKKVTDHDHDKYIITPEFNKLTVENFAGKISKSKFSYKDKC